MTKMEDNTTDQTPCPVARAESVVGDHWTVLIQRELLMQMHRFEQIQAQTSAQS
jgi:DNA-binding HxlR family transcriptional regulator